MGMAIGMFGMGSEMAVEMYVIDDVMYAMTDDPSTGEAWVKGEVPPELWGQMNQIEPQMEMLELVQVDLAGSETVKGNDCYVLELKPDMQQLWQLFNEQAMVSEEELLPEIDTEMLQQVFKGFSVKQWINKETYVLHRAQIEMNMEMTAEDLGFSEEEGSMVMTLAMDIIAYDYNQPIDIVLPAGAENAVDEGDLYGDYGNDDYTYLTLAEEANSEAFDVDMAVWEAMMDAEIYDLTAGGTVGPGYASSVYADDGVTELDMEPYLYSYLEATYTLDEYGWVVAAEATPGGKWDGLTYTEEYGWME
jgi:hypothetical protein